VVNATEWLEHPGTVGRPIPGTKLRILDDDGKELAPREIGTVYFSRYTGERFEYRNDPEKTQAAYRGDVFTVGDVGYVDESGYLYLCDRKIDLVICGGMNIYPAEIEQILVEHPRIVDCAVFGVPDALMGEALHAVVQPAVGVATNDELTADITLFLRQRLAAVKLPRRIEYLKELPRDPNGKLYKRALRNKYWDGHARKL
jgi:long-chain acyl-CoA synthetase